MRIHSIALVCRAHPSRLWFFQGTESESFGLPGYPIADCCRAAFRTVCCYTYVEGSSVFNIAFHHLGFCDLNFDIN